MFLSLGTLSWWDQFSSSPFDFLACGPKPVGAILSITPDQCKQFWENADLLGAEIPAPPGLTVAPGVPDVSMTAAPASGMAAQGAVDQVIANMVIRAQGVNQAFFNSQAGSIPTSTPDYTWLYVIGGALAVALVAKAVL